MKYTSWLSYNFVSFFLGVGRYCRTHKRYYYRNISTNEAQWTYPQTDIAGGTEEMELCTTPPPPEHEEPPIIGEYICLLLIPTVYYLACNLNFSFYRNERTSRPIKLCINRVNNYIKLSFN